MNILLLAAGRGSRLSPLTNEYPKCLLPVFGKPIISYWIDKALSLDSGKIFINIHHRMEDVRDYVESNYPNSGRIILIEEEKLQGTGKTLLKLGSKLKDDILAVHVDNYSDLELRNLIEFYRLNSFKSCIAGFKTRDVRNSGMIELNHEILMSRYEHKPDYSSLEWANAGVFLFNLETLEFLSRHQETVIDISQDCLPLLTGKINVYKINGVHVDIGTDIFTYSNIEEIIRNYKTKV